MVTKATLSRRDMLRLGAAAGMGVFIAGCGSSDDGSEGSVDVSGLTGAELEEQARSEGSTLLWYNAGNPDLVDSVTSGFMSAYSWLQVEGVPVPFTDLPSKVATEAITEAPTADVIWFPPTLRQQMTENLILTNVTLEGDSNMPPDTLDQDEIAHPVWQLGTGLVYNPNVTTPPSDPMELADPKWKGKIAFDRVANLGQSTTWLSAWRGQMGDDAWLEWLDGIAANDVFITPNAGEAHATVLRGEAELGIASSNYVLSQDPGASVEMNFQIPLVPFYNHQYLTRRARRPACAKLFMEWASTEEGQRAIAEVGLSPIMKIDTDSSLQKFMPQGGELLPGTELEDFSSNTKEYVDILVERWPN